MEEKELRLMPTPETNILKTTLAENLRDLSAYVAEIDYLIDDMLSTTYDHTKESREARLIRELEITKQSRVYKALARRILRDIKPYLTPADKSLYNQQRTLLEKKQDFLLEDALNVFDYINEAAKNSNLTELGTKSILPEILDVIDADAIDNGLSTTTPTTK